MARVAREIRLSGVFPAAVTPCHNKVLEPDFSAALELIDFLTKAGVDGVCLFGTTGEFLNHSIPDRQRLLYLAVKRSRVPLIAGVSHSSLAGAIQLASDAAAAGADALLLMPPCFFRYSQPAIETFYNTFARELGDALPILLYNIPAFTSPIQIDTVRRLLDTGRFAGIKDSSADWPYFEQLLALRGERDFALFSGAERFASRSLAEGADGLISGFANAVPELVVALYKAAKSGDAAHAGALNLTLNQLLDRTVDFPWPAAMRRAVELRGQKSGQLGVPLSPDEEVKMAAFAEWFKTWLPGASG